MKIPVNKFHAEKNEADGYTWDSKIEKDYYFYLVMLKNGGAIRYFDIKPVVTLPMGRWKLDFLVYHNDGNVSAVDVKGYGDVKFFKQARQFEKHPLGPLVVIQKDRGRFVERTFKAVRLWQQRKKKAKGG